MTLHPIPLNFLIYEERFIFFFISVYKEIKKGAVAKSRIRKCFLIYEKLREYLVINEEAVCHIWLCTRSLLNFLIRGNIWVLGSNPQSFETTMNKQVHVHCMESIEEEVVCPPVEFRKQLLLNEEWDMKTFVCVQCARCGWERKGRK